MANTPNQFSQYAKPSFIFSSRLRRFVQCEEQQFMASGFLQRECANEKDENQRNVSQKVLWREKNKGNLSENIKIIYFLSLLCPKIQSLLLLLFHHHRNKSSTIIIISSIYYSLFIKITIIM